MRDYVFYHLTSSIWMIYPTVSSGGPTRGLIAEVDRGYFVKLYMDIGYKAIGTFESLEEAKAQALAQLKF